MAKKFYAVSLTNGQKKILTSWPEAQAFIATCPSSASYKGFPTEAEALAFLNPPKSAPVVETGEVGVNAIAYVDGSYNKETRGWGFGVVLYDKADETAMEEFSGSGIEFNTARNVAGEVFGSMKATEIAIQKGFKSITIYHDYEGIEAWVTGRWRANQKLTQTYFWQMEDYKKKINISFKKVAAHTGVKYNERADELAKKAAGLK